MSRWAGVASKMSGEHLLPYQFYPISLYVTRRSLLSSLCQVNIQPSEWHRSLLLPQAWRGFMSRAYHAVLQVCMCVSVYVCKMTRLLYWDVFKLISQYSINHLAKHTHRTTPTATSKKQSPLKHPIAVNYYSVSCGKGKVLVCQCRHERVFE